MAVSLPSSAGYFALKKLFPDWSDALLLGVAGSPLILALLTITLPAWLKRRRDRKLIEEGISGTLNDPEYFRIWPYEARDRSATRDQTQRIRRYCAGFVKPSPVLYLTGYSGTGKSSVLRASVLPALKEDKPPYVTLAVRSYHDPLAEITAELGNPSELWEKPPFDLPAELRGRLSLPSPICATSGGS